MVHICSGDVWGGSEAQVALLLPELRARGADVHAILFNPGRLEDTLRASGVPTHVLPEDDGSLRLIGQLRRALRDLRPDVVHAHGYKEGLLGFAASLGTGARRVRTLHGVPELPVGGSAGRMALYDRLDVAFARLLGVRGIAVSKSLFASESARWRGRLAMIPNCVTLEPGRRDRGELRASLGVDRGVPLLLYVGRLEPIKGVDVLVEALPAMVSALPELEVWVVGSGSLEASLAQRARELTVGGALRFLGVRDDVPELLRAADLLAMPSRGEGMPTLLLEALVAGCAVVASRVGGVVEVTRDGAWARLVPAEDPQALAAACAELLGDAEARAGLIANARPGEAEEYAPARCAERVAALYGEIGSQGFAAEEDGTPALGDSH